jgi:hypothetical protein
VQHHVVPLRVHGGEGIQDDGDERRDVLDHNNLSVEVGDHGSILGGGVVVEGGYSVVGLQCRHLLGGEHLMLEGPGGFPLLLQGEGGGALT